MKKNGDSIQNKITDVGNLTPVMLLFLEELS